MSRRSTREERSRNQKERRWDARGEVQKKNVRRVEDRRNEVEMRKKNEEDKDIIVNKNIQVKLPKQ